MKTKDRNSDLSVAGRVRLIVATTLILTVCPVLVIYYLLRGHLVNLWYSLVLKSLKKDVEMKALHDHLVAKRPMWNQIQPLQGAQFGPRDLG